MSRITWSIDPIYGWHAMRGGKPLCPDTFAVVLVREELPIGAHPCAECVRLLVAQFNACIDEASHAARPGDDL